jgi:hypothetical protein
VLPEQRGEMKQIMRAAKIRVSPKQVNPMAQSIDPEVLSLIGEVAPRVDPRVTEQKRAAAQTAQQRAAGHAPAGEGRSTGANAKRKRSRGGRGRGPAQGAGSGQQGSQQSAGGRQGGQGGQDRAAQSQGQRRGGSQQRAQQPQSQQRSQGGSEAPRGRRRGGRRAQSSGGTVYSTSSPGA